MIIGLDLSVIQTPHRMRGIGATAINFINNMSEKNKQKHTYVLYLYSKDQAEALKTLKLDGINYTIEDLIDRDNAQLKLPGKLRVLSGFIKSAQTLVNVYRGDQRIESIDHLDAFLQFDPMQPLPRSTNTTRGLVLYDLIPYVMEADYLWSYRTARQHQHSRKGALRKALLRKKYITTARIVSKQADMLFAISEHTKRDYVRYANIKENKIAVTPLGISSEASNTAKVPAPFLQYITNSWGAFPKPVNLEEKPFLLFVGGVDPRRKLSDLVAAYNNLKAQGRDIRLVLAGDSMKGPYAIPVPQTQRYITHSSYLDDIAFVGFVSDKQREWLYGNAVAMIYPSMYEGFGLPILEAMRYGTPVITYDNTSIREISGDAALYAHNARTIQRHCEELLNNPELQNSYSLKGKEQASKFSWTATSEQILTKLSGIV